MNNQIKSVDNILKFFRNPNLVFYVYLAVFVLDNVVNYFVSVPIFVPFSIVMLPVLWWIIWLDHSNKKFFIIFTSVFLVLSLITTLTYGFNKNNVADVSFILLFATSFYYYQSKLPKLSTQPVYVFLIVSFLMLSFAFFNINSDNWLKNDLTLKDRVSKIEFKDKPTDVKPLRVLTKVSLSRTYNGGLFRVPHVASLFFGFLFLLLGYLYFRQRNMLFALVALASLALMVFTGARTFLIAAGIGFFLFLFRRKSIIFAMSLVVAGILLIVFRYQLFDIFKETFLGSYIFLVINLIDNYEGINRIVLFQGWWTEYKTFGGFDLLTGKGFIHSVANNNNRNHMLVWLHNDFTSISYAYGLSGLAMYVLLFVCIFKSYHQQTRQNIFVFIYYISMIASAFITGFYYQFTIFLIYIFMLMVKMETDNKSNEYLQ